MSKEDKEVLDMANGVRGKTEPANKESGGMGKFLHKKGFIPLWRRPEFWRLISEVAGWTGFGGVMLGVMLAGCCHMGVAVPVFTLCFAWGAILVDRYFRR